MSGEAAASVTTALFGLDGFSVLGVADAGGELELLVETTADLVVYPECGRWRGPRIDVRRGRGICPSVVDRW